MTLTEIPPLAAARPDRPPTLAQMAKAAIAVPAVRDDATFALDLFCGYCIRPMPRIPGCDTWIRLAIRVHRGMNGEQAAAAEYRYRWNLFLGAWHNHLWARSRSRFVHDGMCYPAPHLLGQ